jgi:hypothetical protein
MASFNRSSSQFSDVLDEVDHRDLVLPDKNYDTGDFTPAGVYRLNDETHAFWLHKLAEKKFEGVTPVIKQELLTFYRDPNKPDHSKTKPDEWQRTLSEIAALKQ